MEAKRTMSPAEEAHEMEQYAEGRDHGKVSGSPSTNDDSVPMAGDSQAQNGGKPDINFITGPRFYIVSVLLGLNFFMVAMELSVVATAVVSISDDIGGFESSSWIMTSYLLGYVALVIIFSKLSDIYGRKPLLVLCITTFLIFSGACGAAQTITQLIILRAFQGVGGGGCFAMNMVMMTEMVRPEKYGQFAAYMGIPAVLSLGLGPLIGGGIVSTTTWRWVFLVNLPIGALALALAVFAIPNGFPYHGKPKDHGPIVTKTGSAWRRVDFVGSTLLFLATLALTAGFSEADSRFAWDSAYVISLLVVAVVLWFPLIFWERHISIRQLAGGLLEPVLPWRFLTNRVIGGMLLGSILLGGPMTASLFVIPSRFQLVNGVDGLDAGIRLLPFALASGYGAIVGSTLAGRVRLPPIFVAMGGSLLQVTGLALLGTLPATEEIVDRTYGFLVLAGFGTGVTYQSFYITMPVVAARQDAAVGMGAVTQFRMMGGAVVLAIATSVFNGHVLPALQDLGISSTEELIALNASGQPMSQELREVLNEGYNRQMLVLCASAGAQLFAVLLMWKKQQIRLPR